MHVRRSSGLRSGETSIMASGVTPWASKLKMGATRRLQGVRTLNSPAYGVATPLHCVHHHRPSGTAGSVPAPDHAAAAHPAAWQDRKSTRLNSSHLVISYAVFCLKKKIN